MDALPIVLGIQKAKTRLGARRRGTALEGLDGGRFIMGGRYRSKFHICQASKTEVRCPDSAWLK